MWIVILVVSLVFIGGVVVGAVLRDLYDLVDDLYQGIMGDRMKEPALGPTLGSYADPETPKPPTAHVVNPKGPKTLEWERQNRQPEIMGPPKE